MQEQKIDKTVYLALQNTYEEIEVVLYNQNQLLGKKNIHKNEASKTLLFSINSLLKQNSFSLSDLKFIGINKGPGPFTTLRVIIATVNAINFATKIPLIGINGLKAYITESHDNNWPITVILLNAFNNDVYYAIEDFSLEKKLGCTNINDLLNELKNLYREHKTIRFLGNGSKLFENEIKTVFRKHYFIPENNPNTCSIETIAKLAFEKWKNNKDLENQILPIYLKDAVKIKKN